jgi:hypothetical protein
MTALRTLYLCCNDDQMTMTTTLGNTSTTSTVIDISTDERAPLNMAYRYNPEGSVIHWNPPMCHPLESPASGSTMLGIFPVGPLARREIPRL